MISFVLTDSKKEEVSDIKDSVRSLAAFYTDEHWEYHILTDINQYYEYIESKLPIHFCCFDVCLDDSTNFLTGLRNDYDKMQLILIADRSLSPYKYLKPGIRPDSVLLRPFCNEELNSVMDEFISSGIRKLFADKSDSSFLITNKDESILLEYNNIFYFESREKKVFARTLKEEYGFYKSLEELQDELPDYFIRCHRSYIVNINLVRRINTSDSLIEMKQNFSVPVSRSYKPIIKDRINEL